MSQNNNLSILPFYDSRSKQNHLKWWAYDKVFALITELDTLPTFQIQKKVGGHPVTSLVLVDFNTEVETDILSLATTAGLIVTSFDDYDLVIYPSTVPLGIPNIKPGHYFLRIGYSGLTLYSEVFNMSDDVSDFIKLEYYNNSKFCYAGGHIEYTFPYKNRIYIPSDIAKPLYEYEEKVIKREGYNFALQQVSFKLSRFSMFAPEYLIDAIRSIRMHDHCIIQYAGYEYDVDEMLMNSPKWLEQGDIAEVEIEFKTDTIVVANAKGSSDVTYEADPGSCILTNHNCVALIIKDSTEYNNFEYNPSDGGAAIPFASGESVLIHDTVAGRIELFDFTTLPNSYEQQNLLPFEVAFDANNDKYYFAPSNETDNVSEPFITSVTNLGSDGLVFGEAFENTVVEIWVRYTDQNNIMQEEKRGQALSSILMSTGVPFIYDGSVTQVKLKINSALCSLFSESPWFILIPAIASGIGLMGIEYNFIIG